MILKRCILLIAFVWGAAAAQATTLADVTVVVDGPTMNDDSGIVGVTPFGVSFTGSLAATSSTVGPMGVVTTDPLGVLQSDFNGPSNLFVAQSAPAFDPILGFIPPAVLLTGTSIDAAAGTDLLGGFIQALFSTTGGTLASDYGSLFRVTLRNAAFTASSLDVGAPIVVSGPNTVALVEAVTAPGVVPLPAGIWLLLGGIGGLVTLRKRSQRAAAA